VVDRDGGCSRRISVRTTDPERHFAIEIGADAVTFSTGSTSASPRGGENRAADLALPAEAFIRLVYGRLDPDHTPEFEGDEATLDRLRKVFPGP